MVLFSDLQVTTVNWNHMIFPTGLFAAQNHSQWKPYLVTLFFVFVPLTYIHDSVMWFSKVLSTLLLSIA